MFALGGCATQIAQTPIPDCTAKSCFTEMKGKVSAGGGGRYGVAGITIVGKDGSQNFRPITDGVFPDRIDTLFPSLFMAGAQVGSASIQANAIKSASKKSGPSQVFVLAPEGGDATALQNTEVGVVTQQGLNTDLQPVHFCNTCDGGN